MSLAENTKYPHRITVVDNHSVDGTIEWLKAHKKKYGLRLYLRPRNEGSAKARMIGIERCGKDSDIVAVSDDDVWYRSGWLEECMRVLEQYPKVAIASVHNPGEPHQKNVLGMAREGGVEVIFRTAITPMHWVFRKQPLIEAGGFTLPSGRVMGYAGTPLCTKMRKLGWDIARSTKRGVDEKGKEHWLVEPMDTTRSHRNHRSEYDQSGYNVFRRLAKVGKVNDFEPRRTR